MNVTQERINGALVCCGAGENRSGRSSTLLRERLQHVDHFVHGPGVRLQFFTGGGVFFGAGGGALRDLL